jgi:hypothetical protein
MSEVHTVNTMSHRRHTAHTAVLRLDVSFLTRSDAIFELCHGSLDQ